MCTDWFSSGSPKGLESKFLEKPFVLAGLVSFLERSLEGSLAFSLSGGVLNSLLINNRFVNCDIDGVSSGHKVVVVDDLHKRLNFGALGHLLLAHGLGDLARVAVDSRHEGVSVTTVLGSVVLLFDDDGLASGVPSSED